MAAPEVTGPGWRVIQADVLEGLKSLPRESVHCVVTSPPYWGLRDYGAAGQIGLEPTVEEWVAKMVEVFEEVKRALRHDGTCWLNLGDSYIGKTTSTIGTDGAAFNQGGRREAFKRPDKFSPGLKTKDLVGAPWRVAFALQSAGWYLRSDIVWSKPNPMPESVTDRPTRAHEYVFLLTKAERYFYDAEAVREPMSDASLVRMNQPTFDAQQGGPKDAKTGNRSCRKALENLKRHGVMRRNKRTVWEIGTMPYPEAHFATFPPALVEPCIRAGTSEKGVCAECGMPWRRQMNVEGGTIGRSWHDHKDDATKGQRFEKPGPHDMSYSRTTTGWKVECQHDGVPVPATVLDPFAGTSTTGQVALENGRHYIGIELDPKSVKLSEKRLKRTACQPSLC